MLFLSLLANYILLYFLSFLIDFYLLGLYLTSILESIEILNYKVLNKVDIYLYISIFIILLNTKLYSIRVLAAY